jgi:hypothetical protein
MVGHNMNGAMGNKTSPASNADQPLVYQIRIKGHLGQRWTDQFDGLMIKLVDNGDTLITGPVVDQAALHGLLRKVRDLGMPLVSVNRIETGEQEPLDDKKNESDRPIIS